MKNDLEQLTDIMGALPSDNLSHEETFRVFVPSAEREHKTKKDPHGVVTKWVYGATNGYSWEYPCDKTIEIPVKEFPEVLDPYRV